MVSGLGASCVGFRVARQEQAGIRKEENQAPDLKANIVPSRTDGKRFQHAVPAL